MLAYILITAEKGLEQEIYNVLSDYSEILGVHILFGEWDLLVKLDVENTEALGTFVMDKVRVIEGVQMSSTLIVAK
ncbi:Lrp/AsnC ligand binding domain-containing protein [Candidatus Woesearchaeota archaeon]|nr:Lrp/AsnC ligand binding domain-containing protein [Candidatus Woesearchaeota archaeon]